MLFGYATLVPASPYRPQLTRPAAAPLYRTPERV
jgi:hypothetical protein